MAFIKWLIKNLPNIFSVIGIILALYFGAYSVPSYVTEVRQEKINSAKKDIITTIQELFFNKNNIRYDEVEKVIRGKELQYGVNIPDSPKDILLQTEALIYDQKYLTLNLRLEIIAKLDSLYELHPTIISDSLNNSNIKETSIYSDLFSWVFASFSVIISLLALISVAKKLKKEKDMEVIGIVSEREDEIIESAHSAFEFENKIMELVKRIVGNHPDAKLAVAFSEDRGWDFRIDYKGRTFLSEIKFLSQKSMNSTVVDKLFSSMKMLNANGIIITNKFVGLTSQAAINAINHKSKTLRIITVDSDFEDKLLKIIFSDDAT